MLGQMMHRPMQVSDSLKYAETIHGGAEIISSTVEGGIHRATYRETASRSRKLSKALLRLGVEQGDRVATLAWNGYRHFELYYAIPGVGAICHTINPRLSADQLSYVVGHAEDKLICLDLTFVPMIEELSASLPLDMIYVIMTDSAHMPETSLPRVLCYEDLIANEDDDYDWPEFPEDTAIGLCYTSGTTGNPKGALYSHRSTLLHAFSISIAIRETFAPGRKILPAVPMFHVNAWSIPYAAPLNGSSLVLPGPHLDGPSLFQLMNAEQVHSAWGVPTIWLSLLGEVKEKGQVPEGLRELVIGGAAAPRALIEDYESYGMQVCHAWGMTEMSPIGTFGYMVPPYDRLDREEQLDLKALQGLQVFGVDFKIVDDEGVRLPHDGQAIGELYVRGNTVISGYFKNVKASEEAIDAEGWFCTGDIAAITPEGFLRLTDRSKDLIKSGGEWISSIDIENMAMAHSEIDMCAVIAIEHPKWGQRPLLVVKPVEGTHPDKQNILDHLAKHLAKWQVPDAVECVESIPLTATGKISKLTLRKQFEGYRLD